MNSVKFVDTKFCGLRENVACQESGRSCVTCVRGINFVCSYDFFMIFCSGDKMSFYTVVISVEDCGLLSWNTRCRKKKLSCSCVIFEY
jgi:hypothetical protein